MYELLAAKLQESLNSTNQAQITAEIERLLSDEWGIVYLNQMAFLDESLSDQVRALAALLCKNRITKLTRESLIIFISDSVQIWFSHFALVKSEFLKKALRGIIATAVVHGGSVRLQLIHRMFDELHLYFPVLLEICEECASAFTANESKNVIAQILEDTSITKAKKALILAQFRAEQIFSVHEPATLIPFFELQPGASEADDLCVAEFLLHVSQELLAFSAFLPYYLKYAQLSHSLLEFLNEFIDTDMSFFSEFLKKQSTLASAFLHYLLNRCLLTDEGELCRALEDLSVPDKQASAAEQFMYQDSDDEEEEEGQINELDETESLDSLRNCSLAILQVLTLCFPPQQLSALLLPLLFERLESPELLVRESAFSAFAVCNELTQAKEFCGQLPNLLDFALAQASHPHALIRASSIQCLGNYSNFLVKFHANFPQKSKLNQIKQILLVLLQDANKRVQEAACRAILQLCKEKCRFDESLLPALFWALARFQVRNRRLVYALICEVAELFEAEHWKSIFQLLIERFDNQSIQDSSVFPLIEALIALQPRAAFSQNLFTKACALALNALKTIDFSESFLTAALDLLDAMTEAHPQNIQSDLICSILQETFAKAEETETLQSAFALFGDLSVFNEISSYWPALKANYRPTSIFPSFSGDRIVSLATASNAIWSFGLLCLKIAPSLQNSIQEFQSDLIQVLKEKPRTPLGCSIYFENIAIALGRSARICPLRWIDESIRNRILQLLSKVEDSTERESALTHFL